MTDKGRLLAWARDQWTRGLPAFEGARVSGTLPLEVSLVNELLEAALADMAEAPAGPAPDDTTERQESVGRDLPRLARMVRRLRVKADAGVITVEFEVGSAE